MRLLSKYISKVSHYCLAGVAIIGSIYFLTLLIDGILYKRSYSLAHPHQEEWIATFKAIKQGSSKEEIDHFFGKPGKIVAYGKSGTPSLSEEWDYPCPGMTVTPVNPKDWCYGTVWFDTKDHVTQVGISTGPSSMPFSR